MDRGKYLGIVDLLSLMRVMDELKWNRVKCERRGHVAIACCVALVLFFVAAPSWAQSQYEVLRNGSNGPDVVLAQHLLYRLGYLSLPPDGVFGPTTEQAVRKFQQDEGLPIDGIVGSKTWTSLKEASQKAAFIHVVQAGDSVWSIARQYRVGIDQLIQVNQLMDPALIRIGQELVVPHSRSVSSATTPMGNNVELVRWEDVQKIFTPGTTARVTDLKTGRSFQVRRFYGSLHADSEPLTAQDTQVMREIYGGWSWERRPIILEVEGRRIAASMNGYPHGQGAVADNNFPGHFCIHFLGSRIHRTGRIDLDHQTAVLEAAGYSVNGLWLANR